MLLHLVVKDFLFVNTIMFVYGSKYRHHICTVICYGQHLTNQNVYKWVVNVPCIEKMDSRTFYFAMAHS